MATRFFRVAATAAKRVPRVGVAAASLASGAFALNVAATAAAAPAPATAAVPYWGKPGTPAERTFIALKPDAVQRGLIGEIIHRFEAKGYKLVALKMVTPTLAQAQAHYSDLSTKPFFPGLCEFFSSGPVVAMVWEGQGAILGGRKLLGTTNPNDSAPGSIRGDFAVVTGRNIIHGSDGPDSAEAEIKHWFTPAEVSNWKSIEAAWVYEKTA